MLGPERTKWGEIADHKAEFAATAKRVLDRAAAAGVVRPDLSFVDFVVTTRGAMATMNPDDAWRRHLTLVFEGINTPAPRGNPSATRPPGDDDG